MQIITKIYSIFTEWNLFYISDLLDGLWLPRYKITTSEDPAILTRSGHKRSNRIQTHKFDFSYYEIASKESDREESDDPAWQYLVEHILNILSAGHDGN